MKEKCDDAGGASNQFVHEKIAIVGQTLASLFGMRTDCPFCSRRRRRRPVGLDSEETRLADFFI